MTGELQHSTPVALPAPAASALPAGPLDRPPTVPGDADPYWRLVTAFLLGYPPHSSRAYVSDLKAYRPSAGPELSLNRVAWLDW